MKTWKNESAEIINDVSVVFFAQSEFRPMLNGKWAECDEDELTFSKYDTHLFTQGGSRYFGKM